MVDLKSLVGPERIIVERLTLDEPIPIINAWLQYNGFKPTSEDGINNIKSKYNEIIALIKAAKSQDVVLTELDSIRDKLVKMSGEELEPKDLAQLSNALNAVTKTINEYIEKKKSVGESNIVDATEYIDTLKFLDQEGFISITQERLDELRNKLLEAVPEE